MRNRTFSPSPHAKPASSTARLPDCQIIVKCPCCEESLKITLPFVPQVEIASAPDTPRPSFTPRYGAYCMLAWKSSNVDLDATAEEQGWKVIDSGTSRRKRFDPDEDISEEFAPRPRALAFLVTGGVAVLLGLLFMAARFVAAPAQNTPPAPLSISQLADLSHHTLEKFLAAQSSAARIEYVVNPAEDWESIKAFYSATPPDSAFQAASFKPMPELLSAPDLERQIMCLARCPDISQGNSAVPSAIAATLGTPEDLTPRLFFFKGGLIDWPTYSQQAGKTLAKFFATPGAIGAFRILAVRESDSLTISVCDLCSEKVVLGELPTVPHDLPSLGGGAVLEPDPNRLDQLD